MDSKKKDDLMFGDRLRPAPTPTDGFSPLPGPGPVPTPGPVPVPPTPTPPGPPPGLPTYPTTKFIEERYEVLQSDHASIKAAINQVQITEDTEIEKIDELTDIVNQKFADTNNNINTSREAIIEKANEVRNELRGENAEISLTSLDNAITAAKNALSTQLETHDQDIKDDLRNHDQEVKQAILDSETRLREGRQGEDLVSLTSLKNQITAHDTHIEQTITDAKEELRGTKATVTLTSLESDIEAHRKQMLKILGREDDDYETLPPGSEHRNSIWDKIDAEARANWNKIDSEAEAIRANDNTNKSNLQTKLLKVLLGPEETQENRESIWDKVDNDTDEVKTAITDALKSIKGVEQNSTEISISKAMALITNEVGNALSALRGTTNDHNLTALDSNISGYITNAVTSIKGDANPDPDVNLKKLTSDVATVDGVVDHISEVIDAVAEYLGTPEELDPQTHERNSVIDKLDDIQTSLGADTEQTVTGKIIDQITESEGNITTDFANKVGALGEHETLVTKIDGAKESVNTTVDQAKQSIEGKIGDPGENETVVSKINDTKKTVEDLIGDPGYLEGGVASTVSINIAAVKTVVDTIDSHVGTPDAGKTVSSVVKEIDNTLNGTDGVVSELAGARENINTINDKLGEFENVGGVSQTVSSRINDVEDLITSNTEAKKGVLARIDAAKDVIDTVKDQLTDSEGALNTAKTDILNRIGGESGDSLLQKIKDLVGNPGENETVVSNIGGVQTTADEISDKIGDLGEDENHVARTVATRITDVENLLTSTDTSKPGIGAQITTVKEDTRDILNAVNNENTGLAAIKNVVANETYGNSKIKTDTGNIIDKLNNESTGLAAIKAVVGSEVYGNSKIKDDTNSILGKLDSNDSGLAKIKEDTASIKQTVEAITIPIDYAKETTLANATNGLGAIKSDTGNIKTTVGTIATALSDTSTGLGALKDAVNNIATKAELQAAISGINTTIGQLSGKVDTLTTVVASLIAAINGVTPADEVPEDEGGEEEPVEP